MSHFVITLEWYGPYSLEEAEKAAKGWGPGMYMCIGQTDGETSSKLQYVGVSGGEIVTRIKDDHHKLHDVKKGRRLWLGYVSSAQAPGRKYKKIPRSLDEAEWLHAFFLNLPLNEMKTVGEPKDEATVYNRWWMEDDTPRRRRPHQDWPDIIDFPDATYPARIIKFGRPVRLITWQEARERNTNSRSRNR